MIIYSLQSKNRKPQEASQQRKTAVNARPVRDRAVQSATDKLAERRAENRDLPGEQWRRLSFNADYLVSTHGRVRSLKGKEELILKPKFSFAGYHQVAIWNKGIENLYAIHRLVAGAFLENPRNLPQVNHKDSNKTNNHLDNLEWCDAYENMRHAMTHGLKREKRRPCAVVEDGRIVRKYPSGRALARAEGLYYTKILTQLRQPHLVARPYNIIPL